MNFYRSDFKHKIYGLYTGKYGMYIHYQWPRHLAVTFLDMVAENQSMLLDCAFHCLQNNKRIIRKEVTLMLKKNN